MDGKAQLGLALAGSIASLLAAGYGHLEPGYELQSGRVTHSWSVAKVSGERVVDVSPNLGWLKLMCSAGAIGLALWALTESYGIEEAESHASKERSAIAAGRLEVLKLSQAAELEAMKPVVSAAAETKAQDEVVKMGVTGKVAALPGTEFVTEDVKPDKYEKDLPNFADVFGRAGLSSLVVGVPQSGKGMFVSHAGRAYRDQNPNALIWVLDLKGDEKESGYWKEWPNKVFSKGINTFKDPEMLLEWVETIVYKFRDIQYDGPKLLIFDEFNATCERCFLVDKKRFKYVISYILSIISNGSSTQQSFWGMGQIANAEDYGFSGGKRSMLVPIALVYKGNKAASKQLLGTQFAPTDDKDAVMKMMDYSPVGRAIYFGPEGQWYPMPELHNYSGYNRDKRAAV